MLTIPVEIMGCRLLRIEYHNPCSKWRALFVDMSDDTVIAANLDPLTRFY